MDSAEFSAASGREAAMWLLEQLAPGSGVNNLNFAFRLAGALRTDLLEEVLRATVRRYDVLRTVFHADGSTITKRVLESENAEPTVVYRDSTEDALNADLNAFVAEPFLLEDEHLLIRAVLFQLPAAQVFCVVVHHLIADAMSIAILRDEFIQGYDTVLAGKPLPIERVETIPEPKLEPESVQFWRSRLEGYEPTESSLWLGDHDFGEPTLIGSAVQRDLSDEARDVVLRLRRELRAPDSVILLAAYYLLLSLHGAGSDLMVASPINTRPQTALSTIGYHVNLLPLRMRVDPSSGFRTLVAETRRTFMEGLAHTSALAEVLVERADRTWRSPLFRYLFNYVPYYPGASISLTIGGFPARQLDVENGSSRFDLEFFVPPFPSSERIRIRAVYRDQMFTREEIELLLSRYDELIVTVGSDVDHAVDGWPQLARANKPAPASTATIPKAPDWLIEKLRVLWQELLGRDDIAADANFFAAGGNSLRGALLVQRIKDSLHVPVKLADLFAAPTPNMLATRLRERLPR